MDDLNKRLNQVLEITFQETMNERPDCQSRHRIDHPKNPHPECSGKAQAIVMYGCQNITGFVCASMMYWTTSIIRRKVATCSLCKQPAENCWTVCPIPF